MAIELPQKLNPTRNAQFRELYQKHFEIQLTQEEADEEAYRFLSFCLLIIERTPEYCQHANAKH